MRLPVEWEQLLKPYFDLEIFYPRLDRFVADLPRVIPSKDKIFHVFDYMAPADVRVVLYGEDPYPRVASACGVAFWDLEMESWNTKSNGNSMKNILKALLVADGQATYNNSIDECRILAENCSFLSPAELFKLWLGEGVLLVNSALTFSNNEDKKRHFVFWKDFHQGLIRALNGRPTSPFYVLWGAKAQKWELKIKDSIDDTKKIIKQGHPTFIHQFLDKHNPAYSPFNEIIQKTNLHWY